MKDNLGKLIVCLCLTYPMTALALDPISKASNKIESTLFGGLGISICSIIIGATFLMAKVGKITWDKFLFTAICSAGFLGSRSIVNIIQSCVS